MTLQWPGGRWLHVVTLRWRPFRRWCRRQGTATTEWCPVRTGSLLGWRNSGLGLGRVATWYRGGQGRRVGLQRRKGGQFLGVFIMLVFSKTILKQVVYWMQIEAWILLSFLLRIIQDDTVPHVWNCFRLERLQDSSQISRTFGDFYSQNWSSASCWLFSPTTFHHWGMDDASTLGYDLCEAIYAATRVGQGGAHDTKRCEVKPNTVAKLIGALRPGPNWESPWWTVNFVLNGWNMEHYGN